MKNLLFAGLTIIALLITFLLVLGLVSERGNRIIGSLLPESLSRPLLEVYGHSTSSGTPQASRERSGSKHSTQQGRKTQPDQDGEQHGSRPSRVKAGWIVSLPTVPLLQSPHAEADQLTVLHRGDYVTVVSTNHKAGYYECRAQGKQGYLPQNALEYMGNVAELERYLKNSKQYGAKDAYPCLLRVVKALHARAPKQLFPLLAPRFTVYFEEDEYQLQLMREDIRNLNKTDSLGRRRGGSPFRMADLFLPLPLPNEMQIRKLASKERIRHPKGGSFQVEITRHGNRWQCSGFVFRSETNPD